MEEFDDLRGGVGFEDVDLGAGEERGDDFEGGIFGGGADEEDVAGFDVREEGVLLGFVEAVDFVDEDDGAQAGAGFFFGFSHDFFDFFDTAGDGAEGDEFGFGEAGDEARESGLAAAGRAPEEHRTEIVGFDLHAEGFPGAEEFFLADEFVEGAGTHALGEGLESRGGFGFGESGEEAHGYLECKWFEGERLGRGLEDQKFESSRVQKFKSLGIGTDLTQRTQRKSTEDTGRREELL